MAQTDADPRIARHQAMKQRLIDEAWSIARAEGLGGVSLGELARRAGLRQPSLYTYFTSKLDLYDAMFAMGNQELWDEVVERDYPDDSRRAVIEMTRAIVQFCAAYPTRYQLLYQRPVPGFEPSQESYAHAVRFYEWVMDVLARAGVKEQEDLDVYTALVAGIADQQVANDPGGDRWLRHIDHVIEMFLDWLDERGKLRPE